MALSVKIAHDTLVGNIDKIVSIFSKLITLNKWVVLNEIATEAQKVKIKSCRIPVTAGIKNYTRQ